MNDRILKALGYEKEVKRVKDGKCPFCGRAIDYKHGFRDDLSRHENHISGLCQECQDDIFEKGGRLHGREGKSSL